MTTNLLQGLPKRETGSGLTVPDTFRAVPDPIDRRDRFVISPGETLNLRHRQLCRTRIRQGYIERIFLNTPINYNFDEVDLRKYDENTVPRGHKRIEVDYPVTQVRDLLQYRENGLVNLEMLVGLPITDIEDIEAAVLPPVEVYLWQLREWLEDERYATIQIDSSPLSRELQRIAFEMKDEILRGVHTAWAYQTNHLDEREGEMQDRMMPGGRGQSQLSERERHFYKNLNRTPPAARRLELEGERENRGNVNSFIAQIIGQKNNEETEALKRQLAEASELIKKQSLLLEQMNASANSKPATEAPKKTTGQVNRTPAAKPEEAPKAE